MPQLLIVDDEPNVRYALEKGLRCEGREITCVGTGQEGLEAVRQQQPDAVILDVRLPDGSGLDVFNEMREVDPRLPVIIITAHTTTETAIEAMKRGAFEYLLKPYDLDEMKDAVARALELSRLSRVPAVFDQREASDDSDENVDRIVGTSAAMQSVYKQIGRVAPQDVNVLILGESGTGKELVARAIYQHSQRSSAPFLAINCAAIPDTLLESELFGHEKGAYTGADRRRIGKFEQAHNGTIFLDEIGDMSITTQAKVLRVLQDGRFERVGGNETIQTDVRVIAATNRDLEDAIREKAFRQDLFYRLNVFTIHLPPLRERLDDLPQLVEHFIRSSNRELGRGVRDISEGAIEALRQHSWPGNVRELQSALKYALVRASTDLLTEDCLPEMITHPDADNEQTTVADETLPDVRGLTQHLLRQGATELNDKVHQAVDRVLLREVLDHVDGHQSRAAELLGISRTTFRARLNSLGLSVRKGLQNDADQD